MNERLRQNIGEIYDAGAWEPVTGIVWQGDDPWQLMSFEQDVEFEGKTWRCVIVQCIHFDADDLDAVDYAEDVFSAAFVI